MILLLLDEDVTTVSAAITAIANEHGLALVDPESQGLDLFAIAAMLLNPRVVLAAGEDFVVADGLASLEAGDADAWGRQLSAACGNEVFAIAPTGNGIRVSAFDDGEEDDAVDIDVDPSGKTRSEALADLMPTDEAAAELRAGVTAQNAVELASEVLRLLGAGEDRRTEEPTVLSFHDPNAETDADAEAHDV